MRTLSGLLFAKLVIRTVLTFLFLLILAINSFSQVVGKYSKTGQDFTYTLVLSADSTFSFRKGYFEADSKSEGRWKKLSNVSLLLSCFESPLAERLQSGYMNQRNIYVHILNNNRLKIGNVTLRKS